MALLLALTPLARASTTAPPAGQAIVEIEVAELEPADDNDNDIDEAAEAFARMDSDRDGALSLEEFVHGLARPRGAGGGVVYQRLPARFRALDLDASSYLEAAEFDAVRQRWRGPGPAPRTLAASDRSGDGRIDFREFAALLAPRDAAPDPAATR